MQEVNNLSIVNGNEYCSLALALAQTYPDHCPTSCWTSNHYIAAIDVYQDRSIDISYSSQCIDSE